jgi:DNA polymerase I
LEWKDLEADDVMGILMTDPDTGYENILYSQDKDLLTIQGLHLNLTDNIIYEITEQEADRMWMFQTLVGDTADGFKGCSGSGKKDAEKILALVDEKTKGKASLADYWKAVVARYTKAGYSKEDAIIQARLARILRASDYDHDKKRVIHFTPPTID